MSSYQKLIICGRLGKDPETRYTQAGKAVCKFSVAVDDGYGDKKTTEWFRVVCFDKIAENAGKYLAKGRQVLVDGRLKTDKYKDKDGVERTSVEMIAFTVQFLGDNKGGGGRETAPREPTPPAEAPPASDGFIDDDLPFMRCEPMAW